MWTYTPNLLYKGGIKLIYVHNPSLNYLLVDNCTFDHRRDSLSVGGKEVGGHGIGSDPIHNHHRATDHIGDALTDLLWAYKSL